MELSHCQQPIGRDRGRARGRGRHVAAHIAPKPDIEAVTNQMDNLSSTSSKLTFTPLTMAPEINSV